MDITFKLLGKGCDICIASVPEACRTCERNPSLIQLKDNYRKPSKTPPRIPLKDDSSKITAGNRRVLKGWGLHVPPDSNASVSDKQKPKS